MEKLHQKLVPSAFHMLIVVTPGTGVSKALLGVVAGTIIQHECEISCADWYIINVAPTESGRELYADYRAESRGNDG